MPDEKELHPIWFASLLDLKYDTQFASAPQPKPETKPETKPAPQLEAKSEARSAKAAEPKPELTQSALKAQLAKKAFKDTLEKQKPKAQSAPLAQERLQALLERKGPSRDTESYEHAVVYSKEGQPLSQLSTYLIDVRHNGVIRINRKGKVLWHYGFEMGQNLKKPSFIHETSHSLVITDSDQHRVLEISKAGKEILHLLNGPKERPLGQPRCAVRLENGHFMIGDQRYKRLIELSPDDQMVWEFWQESLINTPQSVEVLANGHLLFADSLHNRVTEIDRQGQVQWYYGKEIPQAPGCVAKLFGPSFASRLENGHTLIVDTRHHRVLEVNPAGETVWEYIGHARSSRINPTWAQRLSNGHTLISFFNHTRLIELTPQKACVWSYTMGKDVFLPPVEGDEEQLVQHEAEKPTAFYNAVEKRWLLHARQNFQEVFELHIELMDGVQMKSVRAQMIMQTIEQHGTVFKSFPSPEDLLADRYGKYLIIACILDEHSNRNVLKEAVSGIAEVVSVKMNLPEVDA